MRITILNFFFCLVALVSNIFAVEWHEESNISKIFKDEGVKGTFVLYDVKNNIVFGHNKDRAYRRYIPASTFKIPNSLIGLTGGAVKSVDDILPYGGGEQPFDVWERDMGLRDAIVISNVPIYRELARRIGLEEMRRQVSLLNYGNKKIGNVVDQFWLSGPLKISAIEQVIFLDQLAKCNLKFPKAVQEVVHEITLVEKGKDWELHGKTGLSLEQKPGLGWWVGWVEKGEKNYSFALNIEVHEFKDKDKRIPLGKAALKALGIY